MGNRIDGHGLYMQIGLCRRVIGNGNGRWMLCITDFHPTVHSRVYSMTNQRN